MTKDHKLTIKCPECHAELVVDRNSGTILVHRAAPKKPADGKDLDALFQDMGSRKSKAEKVFEREQKALEDRDRIMEERFKAAFEQAKKTKDEDVPLRPFDLD